MEPLYLSLISRLNQENLIAMDGDGASRNDSPLIAIVTQNLTHLLLFFLIFGMSANLDTKRLGEQARNKAAFATGLIMQFVIMPFLGFLFVFMLKEHGLTFPMSITLLIVTASPGGSYSNLLCSLFNADMELSIAMTSISTILSVIMLPLNLLFYSKAAFSTKTEEKEEEEANNILNTIDFQALYLSIGITVLAIVCGIMSSYRTTSISFRERANKFGSFCGVALIIMSIVFSTQPSTETDGESEIIKESTKPWEHHWSLYVAVAGPCLFGLVTANIASTLMKLEKQQVVTISVECSYQNTGIATSAVFSMFSGSQTERAEAIAVPLFYGIVEALFVGGYCIMAWKLGWTNAPATGDSLCKVLSTRYPATSTNAATSRRVQDEGGSSQRQLDELFPAIMIKEDEESNDPLSTQRSVSNRQELNSFRSSSTQSIRSRSITHTGEGGRMDSFRSCSESSQIGNEKTMNY
jgi:predicted Na+-dependent transporter